MKEHFYHCLSAFNFVFSITCFILFSNTGNAQAPPFVPYQAIARDANGSAVANQTIGLRFSIHDQTLTGPVVWQEMQIVTSNALGVVNTNIGQVLDLSGVNWGNGSKFLQVEMDITGGTNYVDMGTQQMMSVPYALFAGQAASVGSSSNIQIGQTYQGGTVFYIDHTGEHGLIISDTTISGFFQYPSTNMRFVDIPLSPGSHRAFNTSDCIFHGKINTKFIGESFTANIDLFDHILTITHNGYNDWFIPSKLELYLAYSVLGDDIFDSNEIQYLHSSTFFSVFDGDVNRPLVSSLGNGSNPLSGMDYWGVGFSQNWPDGGFYVKPVREF